MFSRLKTHLVDLYPLKTYLYQPMQIHLVALYSCRELSSVNGPWYSSSLCWFICINSFEPQLTFCLHSLPPSPSFTPLHSTRLLAIPQTHRAVFCLRAFALAAPSACSALPQRATCLSASLTTLYSKATLSMRHSLATLSKILTHIYPNTSYPTSGIFSPWPAALWSVSLQECRWPTSAVVSVSFVQGYVPSA